MYGVKERPHFLCSNLFSSDLSCADGLVVVWVESIPPGAKIQYFSFKGKTVLGDIVAEHTMGLSTRKVLFMIEVQEFKSVLTRQFCSCLNGTISIEGIDQQYSE